MRFLVSCFIIMAISGCADSVSFSVAGSVQPVGFWYGLWHGMIAPFAWLVSLFSDSTAIYAIYNNGGWYDFGFMLGIGGVIIVFFNCGKSQITYRCTWIGRVVRLKNSVVLSLPAYQ